MMIHDGMRVEHMQYTHVKNITGVPEPMSSKAMTSNDDEDYGKLIWGDLLNALEFYYVSKDGITIQCPTSKDVPYVKRTLIAHLGEPDKTLGNDFYYRCGAKYKCINIRPALHLGEGFLMDYEEGNTFYVGWESERDIVAMVREGVTFDRCPPILQLWKAIGVDAGTSYDKLLNSGLMIDEVREFLLSAYQRDKTTNCPSF